MVRSVACIHSGFLCSRSLTSLKTTAAGSRVRLNSHSHDYCAPTVMYSEFTSLHCVQILEDINVAEVCCYLRVFFTLMSPRGHRYHAKTCRYIPNRICAVANINNRGVRVDTHTTPVIMYRCLHERQDHGPNRRSIPINGINNYKRVILLQRSLLSLVSRTMAPAADRTFRRQLIERTYSRRVAMAPLYNWCLAER